MKLFREEELPLATDGEPTKKKQKTSSIAYVADRLLGVQIIDVSNSSSPQFLGSYDTLGRAYSVAMSGNCAYSAYAEKLANLNDFDKVMSSMLLVGCSPKDFFREKCFFNLSPGQLLRLKGYVGEEHSPSTQIAYKYALAIAEDAGVSETTSLLKALDNGSYYDAEVKNLCLYHMSLYRIKLSREEEETTVIEEDEMAMLGRVVLTPQSKDIFEDAQFQLSNYFFAKYIADSEPQDLEKAMFHGFRAFCVSPKEDNKFHLSLLINSFFDENGLSENYAWLNSTFLKVFEKASIEKIDNSFSALMLGLQQSLSNMQQLSEKNNMNTALQKELSAQQSTDEGGTKSHFSIIGEVHQQSGDGARGGFFSQFPPGVGDSSVVEEMQSQEGSEKAEAAFSQM